MRINGDDIDNTNYQSGREAGSGEGHQVLCCTQSNYHELSTLFCFRVNRNE